MENCMKLTVPAISENEPFVRDAVAAFCVRLDPTLDQLSDIKTAVSEAVTNCIVHAYAGGEGEIEVECAARDGALHIRISDSGRGIEDVARALEPFFTTLVPWPGLEVTRRASMKLSMMVKPIPLRSSPPVV